MSAYWKGQRPVAAESGAEDRPQLRGSGAPSASLAVGRYMGTVIVTLHGDLRSRASVALAGVLHDLIDGQGNMAVVVDLADVGGIDRSGLDVLASAAARTAERGGALRLGGATEAVFDTLALAGLTMLIDVPSEGANRPWSPGRGVNASRRAAVSPHPAGRGRHDPNTRETRHDPL